MEGKWELISPESGTAPKGKEQSTMVYLPSTDSVVIFGGYNGHWTSDLDLFHVKSSSWEKKECSGKAPPNRSGHAAVYLAPNKMVVIAGYDGEKGKYFSDVHVLDCETWEWKEVEIEGENNMDPRGDHTACVVGEREILVYGGYARKQVDSAWLLTITGEDCAKGAWTKVYDGNAIKPRSRHGAISHSVDGKKAVLMFGGDTGNGALGGGANSSSNESFSFSVEGKEWKKVEREEKGGEEAPKGRNGHSMVCIDAEEEGLTSAIIFGGTDGGIHSMQDTLYASIKGNQTISFQSLVTAEMPGKREGHCAAKVGTKQVLIWGGSQGHKYLNDVWMLEVKKAAPTSSGCCILM